MMKKLLSLLMVLVLSLSFALAASAEGDASLQAVLDKGEFVLGFDASFPPMGYVNEDGDYVGFDLDVAAEVCNRLGVTLKLQPIDWAAKELELNTGNIDCIWNGMTVNAERAESMNLSINYLENAQVLCVMADSPYQTLADLNGKKVALQSGSSAMKAMDEAVEFKSTLAEVIEFPDNVMALMDLDNGTCDGVLLDIIVANYYIATKGSNYRVLGEALAPEFYAIGFRKNDVALTNAVNDTLLAMAADGALAEIAIQWFSEDITIVGK